MPKPISQIRREHFSAHVEKAGGIDKFVSKTNGNPDYVRQVLRGGPKPGTNLGHRKAREYEALLGDPPNSWDQDMEANMPDSIEELRHAIGALYTVVGVMRPDAGMALHSTLKAKAPRRLFEPIDGRSSYLTELVEALDVAVRNARRKSTR
jgi:hypothetical protein